ncbi:MAG: glycosyltransferase [Erysipelotrichales bacterium]|nr:glycosyltransferase [Erysipelotrichales bacterium]
MNIAIFTETYYPFISGVVTHIETLKKGLEKNGHNVLIVTLNPDIKENYIEDGVLHSPAHPLKKIYGYGLANPYSKERFELIKEFKPDLIHAHTEFSLGLAAIDYAKKLNIPIVYTLHTMYDDYLGYVAESEMIQSMLKPFAHQYMHFLSNHFTEIIGPSKKVEEFIHRCGVEKPINLIPNTVDLSAFVEDNVDKEKVREIKESLGIREEDICLGFVGRLGKEKSIDVLMDYFANECGSDPRFKLFIIGKGPEEEELAKKVKDLGMESQIKLLGYIEHDDLPPYYHAFDLYATASTSEMNSISMLEAMASGLYILQRLDIYNRDQIESGVNGDIFETAEDFGKLTKEEADMSLEERYKRRKEVEAYTRRYGIDEFIRSVLQVYEKAVAEYNTQNE